MDAELPELEMDLDVNEIEEIPSESPPETGNEVASKKAKTSRSQLSSTADESDNLNKRKLTSVVWNDMERKIVRGETVAICKHCNKTLSASSANGTSHLRNHLNRCLQNKKQADIRQMLLSIEPAKNGLGNWSFNQEVAWQRLAKAIIVHEYPLSIVEHKYFREFIDGIQPVFKHISRNTMRKKILGIYNVEKEILKDQLKGLNSRVAITTNLWTSNQKRGYMTVTAHYVDSNWMLQSRILNFLYVPTPHTNEVIADCLFNSLLEWGLDRKVSTVTVDNCSTNDAMMTTLQLKMRKEDLILRGKVLHMRCCAHILNLIVKDGISVIEKAIERICDSVAFWSATPARVEKFEKACKQVDVPFSKKLSLDCKTRWNSTYDMLVTAIEYREVFYRVQYFDKNYKCLPTDEDWGLADEICNKLKRFYDVTTMLSSSQYPTENYYFEKVYGIRQALLNWKGSFDLNISMMADKMFENFEKYWRDVHTIMAVYTILDPRYKLDAVEYMFSVVYGEEASKEIERIRNTLYELLEEHQHKSKNRFSKSMDVGSGSSLSPSDAEDPVEKMHLHLKNRATSGSQVRLELDHYLGETLQSMSRGEHFDILSWWKLAGAKYPTLRALAQDMLAIPVTTVASESAFSTSGRVISLQRSRLKPSTIEALMCTQSWLLCGGIGKDIDELEDELEKLHINDYDDDDDEKFD